MLRLPLAAVSREHQSLGCGFRCVDLGVLLVVIVLIKQKKTPFCFSLTFSCRLQCCLFLLTILTLFSLPNFFLVLVLKPLNS